MKTSALRCLVILLASLALVACGSSSSDDGTTDTGGSADTGGTDTSDSDAGADSGGDDAGSDADDDVSTDGGAPDVADSDAGGTDTPEPPMFESRLRIIHLSESTGPLTLWLDGVPATDDGAFDDIAYQEIGPGSGSDTPFYAFPTQNYEAALVPTGEPLENAVYTAPWNFSPDAYYTVFVYGEIDGEGDRVFNVGVSVDDTSIEEGATRIRAFNTMLGSGAVDVRIGAETVFEGLAFGQYMLDYVLAEAPATYTVAAVSQDTGDVIVQQSIDFVEETKNIYFIGDAASGSGLGVVLLNLNNELQLLQE